MQLKYRNNLYTVTTHPTITPSEILQGTYRGLSVAINVVQPKTKQQASEPIQAPEPFIQYRGVKTQFNFS